MAEDDIEPNGKAETILNAAEELFNRHGYRRTSMDDIAAEVGVAKGTLYLYFESKEALFCAIQARNIARAQGLCEAAEARGGTLEERLYGQLEAWFGMMFDRYGASDHLLELSSARSFVSRNIASDADKSYETRLVRIVEEAVGRGDADLRAAGLDADAVVAGLLGAARGAKYTLGKPVPKAQFHNSLRQISQIFAAALRLT